MHQHENHDQREGKGASNRRRVFFVFILTFIYMVVEAVGGWWSGSLALLGDAGHMLTDAGALGLALLAFRLSASPPSPRRSFGLRRAEILAAMFNGVVLLVVALLVVREGFNRLLNPGEVHGEGMLAIAAVGLVVNIVGAYILMGGERSNLNLRGALFHVAGDALGSVGAIAAALVILFTGWTKIDPLVSFVIAVIIIGGAIKLVSDATDIVLEATPRDIDLLEVEKAILSYPGVAWIQDLHVWTITSGFVSMSAHVGLQCEEDEQPSLSDTDDILRSLGKILEEKFGIRHFTLQFEREPCTAQHCETCADTGEPECMAPQD